MIYVEKKKDKINQKQKKREIEALYCSIKPFDPSALQRMFYFFLH